MRNAKKWFWSAIPAALLCCVVRAEEHGTPVATQVDFGGKSLFVAVLAAEGIWFEQDLRLVEKDRTVAVDGWQRPFPAKWMTALDHCQDLIREGAPNLGQRIADFDPQMRGAGEEVDGGMQACRMIVKRIRQEAARVGSEDPATLKFAAAVRQRCRDILRNKHYKEGDDVRLGG